MKFIKMPVVIEATQWFKMGDHPAVKKPSVNWDDGECGWIETLEGGHVVTPGDWIITGVKGEHYPCKPDIFEITYSPVGNEMKDAEDEAFDAIEQAQGWRKRQIQEAINDVLEEVAQEFDAMKSLGDTAASFAAFVRNMKK